MHYESPLILSTEGNGNIYIIDQKETKELITDEDEKAVEVENVAVCKDEVETTSSKQMVDGNFDVIGGEVAASCFKEDEVVFPLITCIENMGVKRFTTQQLKENEILRVKTELLKIEGRLRYFYLTSYKLLASSLFDFSNFIERDEIACDAF